MTNYEQLKTYCAAYVKRLPKRKSGPCMNKTINDERCYLHEGRKRYTPQPLERRKKGETEMNELEEFVKKCEEEQEQAKNPCAWCDRVSNPTATPVSHGICEEHETEVMQSMFEGLASDWGYMI